MNLNLKCKNEMLCYRQNGQKGNNMRIKHTDWEIYKTYSCLPNESELFKDTERWFVYKHFKTKQAAMKSIKKFKEKHKEGIESKLKFKIIWAPMPFANKEDCIEVYNEMK